MTKNKSHFKTFIHVLFFFDQTLCCPSIPILVSVKHPMSNTRFKSMQNDLHTSLLHGQLSRLETGGGEVVGGLLFCWGGVFLPQSATHTVTQSAYTAFAMRLERNEKPTCASVKRAKWWSFSVYKNKLWTRQNLTLLRYIVHPEGEGELKTEDKGEKKCNVPSLRCRAKYIPASAWRRRRRQDGIINSWRERGRRWKMNVVSFPLGMTSQTLWMWRRVCFAPCEMFPFCFVFYSLNGPASNSRGSFLVTVKCLRLRPRPLTPGSSDKWMWEIVSRALRLPFLGKARSWWGEEEMGWLAINR